LELVAGTSLDAKISVHDFHGEALGDDVGEVADLEAVPGNDEDAVEAGHVGFI
jgi:hypothetical protein